MKNVVLIQKLRDENSKLKARLEVALTENDALKASNKVTQEHYSALFADKEAAERERDKLKQELEDNCRADADIQEQIGKLMAERDAALKAVKVMREALKEVEYNNRGHASRGTCPYCGVSDRHPAKHMESCLIAKGLVNDPDPDLVLVPKEQLALSLATMVVENAGRNMSLDPRTVLKARAYLEAEKENR